MAKMRVHELAKELGIDSKTLVSKLSELGYDKKASSSLDEPIADEIRNKFARPDGGRGADARDGVGATGQGKAKSVDKSVPPTPTKSGRAAGKAEEKLAPPAPTKSRPTIILRKKVTVIEPEPELEVEETAPSPLVESGPEPLPVVETVPLPVIETEEIHIPAVVTAQGDVEKELPREPDAEAIPVAAEPLTEAVVEESPAAPAVQPETPLTPPVVPQVTEPSLPDPSRKGLAKVIKRAAIQLPVEEEKPKPRRYERPERPATDRPDQRPRPRPPVTTPKMPGDTKTMPPIPGGDGAEKKGKRFVKIQPDAAEKERIRRGGGKQRAAGEVDIDEMDIVDHRVLASLRLGRTPQRSGGPKKSKKSAAAVVVAETKAIKKRIKIFEFISIGDLAHRMSVKTGEVIAKLMNMGVMATVNQALDVETASLVADEFGYEVDKGVTDTDTMEKLELKESGGEERPRPPVVTVMGHVDHGKTSILDAIRQTDVAASEAGGITQHIGAHYVRSPKGDVVFLDTPGHAAFTAMRSRGAKVTDVVVLVVAADDGVMEQTKEAINHAKAAEVPIVVAVNKIDKPNADPMRVMRELSEFGLIPEEWGGTTIFCQTSAKKKIGLENLLGQILLQAEILELKADPNRRAKGHVIEAQLHKGRGPIATVLVQQGTLRVGDYFVVGEFAGKVRSLTTDKGEKVDESGPSVPVEVQGAAGVPLAGEEFMVVPDERTAKSVSSSRQVRKREGDLAKTTKITLQNLFEKLQEGQVKELRVVLRADVQGTLEAFGKAIEELSTAAIRLKLIHEGTGGITESDVLLAAASEAVIIGFNVRPSAKVADLAKNENVDIRFYDVIYHALEDITKAMVGMLEPTFKERSIGTVEVRQTFHVPKIGTIAGCYVTDGKIERNSKVRLLRDSVVVYTGKVDSLRRFKDEAREVQTGYECGVGLENFNDIKIGDIMEVFVLDEVAGQL